MPYPHAVIRNRIRQGCLIFVFIAACGLFCFVVATSPLGKGAGAPGLLIVYLAVLALCYRMATQRIVADPQSDHIAIRNTFRTWQLRWADIVCFEATDVRTGPIRARFVTCIVANGDRKRVRAAGKWMPSGGGEAVSVTSRQTVSLIAQELNVRLHQHEQGLAIDQWPSP